MQIHASHSDPQTLYRILVGIVTPRPIAWVTTQDLAGVVNLAPFSFYNVMGIQPPVVVFSPLTRRDGSKKDTIRNLEQVPEFVLHAAVESLAEEMNLSAKELPYGESELTLTGLETTPSQSVRPPRLKRAQAAMECRVRQILPVGDGPLSANLVIGEVVTLHLDDAILTADGQIDPDRLATIGRMAGDDYARTRDRFALRRP